MASEIVAVTRTVLAEQERDSPRVRAQVRWFSGFPTITLTRVGDVLYVRPRFLHESHQGRVFFEKYSLEEGAPFEIYAAHFEAAWDAASIPTAAECELVVKDIEAG